MRADGRDEREGGRTRRGLVPTRTAAGPTRKRVREQDIVFDFAGLPAPDVADLAMVLTARLQSGVAGRVWARALPQATWMVLGALGLDHLFHRYPSTDTFN